MIAFVLLIGLILGYYAKQMYTMLKELYDTKHEEHEANKAGVVKISGTKLTKSAPIDLSSKTGAIKRPSPKDIAIQSIVEQEKVRNKALR